ncbi:MAG: hypothetical protein KAS71_06500, partial [Bacteroidales bacterium]|nr:hypothetical protein [Bacteroidales bacterium]
ESFRKEHPDFNFTTDIIVGFPGETEEDFQQTLKIASLAKFSHIHTFRYSLRNGTRAARMEDQIPGKIKSKRSESVRILSEQLEKEYFKSMLHKTQRVLVENPDKNGYATGYGEHYIPIQIKNRNLRKNEFYDVKLRKIEGNKAIGELI